MDKSPPACDPDRTKLKQTQRNEMKQILSLPKKYHEQVFKIISPASENINSPTQQLVANWNLTADFIQAANLIVMANFINGSKLDSGYKLDCGSKFS